MIPVPTHPYRDSAIFYGVLTALLVLVVFLTDGEVPGALIIGAAFFVVATGWSWIMFKRRLEREADERPRTRRPPLRRERREQ